ncbi:Heterogeneous nuclear ribonucleoprotein 1 [Dendrobium catenatum]|uniref:Heterogeneous nuclear ribonucleoprotein 1 n=1 Tax=Dendrobium catenatum TaxID=906689 RepID=A0A2I0WLW0_9ASPA|nr:Heterogeneous nuclear ribonucleoprotein 1 [Dendrobium catenatum]
MESDMGKLFIGGISWDTNEARLREYFENFGEVLDAVIMKDRTTGRARGFGFVVFSDPGIAEKVVMEKHLIDGRMVEAKKAVPRDDQCLLNRNSGCGSIQGSPVPGRIKKIFVGGLASTVTDSDFRKYFEQFGTINDVVVMYDHNTQRPRGFGFITFDSEDAVDKVLRKTFHELNGKMAEVKIAVPKEHSTGPIVRLPIGGLNYGLNRYNQEYNPNSIGSYSMRMDGRFGPLAGGRNGFPPFNPDYGIGLNFEPGMSPTYSVSSNSNNGLSYGRALSPYYSGNSNRLGSPIGYGRGNSSPGSAFSSVARSLLGNVGLNYSTNNTTDSNSFMISGIGNLGGFGNSGLSWADSSSRLSASGINSGGFTGNPNYGSGQNSFGLVAGSYGRNNGTGPFNTSLATTANGYEGNYADSYGGGSNYEDSTWLSASSDLDGSFPFGYGLGTAASDVASKGGSTGYMGGYTVSNRQMNRGKRFLLLTKFVGFQVALLFLYIYIYIYIYIMNST